MQLQTSSLDRRKSIWLPSVNFLVVLLLSLQTSLTDAAKTAADYYVRSLPGQPDGPLLKMHAGHVEVSPDTNGNLFFWHFQNRHIANRPRTVIWLNGGPGCSSEDGALMEIGPYRVEEGGKLKYNDGSWDEFANLLFVDNPVGTGFSYVNTDSYLHELREMSDQFIIFLEKWFTLFPEYSKDDLYIAGESYAGQHIPYIARAILDRNAKTNEKSRWNLKGLLIGNGWIAPVEQYQAYATFAYAEGLIQGGTEQGDKLDSTVSKCLLELGKPGAEDKINIGSCEAILNDILDLTAENNRCVNVYDIRLTDTFPSCGMNWPPDLAYVKPYLQSKEVVAALNINPEKREGWTECSGAVGFAFRAANSVASVKLLPGLLEEGLPILLFSGAKDLICNHLGTEDFISNMKWSNGTGFELSPGVWAPKRDWSFEGEAAGIYQEARNLTYVKFYNSSHMVPFDYPRRTRDMLDRFMGVDIASIGGKPISSTIDGEKSGPETSVGGHPNSTAAEEGNKEKLHQAELKAYYRSGEAVLVVVIIAAALFGWFVWSRRRKEANIGPKYAPVSGGSVFKRFGRGGTRDVEAQDFDEAELENLSDGSGSKKERIDIDAERYDLGSDSEEDSDHAPYTDNQKDVERSRKG